MQLQPGVRLGPYEIAERVGGGGMGEVYRARDTRLGRDVAIKILSAEFADERQRARFEREARTISALNHPHVCTLHDVGRENGVDYLVLEYCEGVTLARRLDRGALPLEQVLQFGMEMAEALSRAHRAGIVHRDLKPSNVMITKSGVKLLDFGVARSRVRDASARTDSLEGQFAGTVGYIAPEVLAGSEAGSRSDIFALGAVLYEMVTGRAAFHGSSAPAVMAAILERDPEPLSHTPPALEHVIQKCLTKNPDERWESAHDIAEELRWIRQGQAAITAPAQRRWGRYAGGIAIALVVIGSVGVLLQRRPPDRVRVSRLSIPLSPGEGEILMSEQPAVAMSHDGRRIAYVAYEKGVSHIYVREVDSFDSMRLAGTEFASGPFFSPDGEWIGFSSGSQLKKVPVAGGNPIVIHTGLIQSRGATWARDGTIYFSPTPASGIWKVSSNGGPAAQVTEPNAAAGESGHRLPEILPDGRHLLFTIRTDQIASFNQAKIALLSLDSGSWRVLIDGGVGARFAPPGHLVFSRDGALHAVRFDPDALSIQGQPRVVLRNVAGSLLNAAPLFAIAANGDLVYVPGPVETPRTTLLKVDRRGETSPLAVFDFNIEGLSVSPDGRRMATSVSSANNDIWVHDFATGMTSRLSTEPGDEISPAWTPDGKSVLYRSTRPHERLMLRDADGRGDAVEYFRSASAGMPSFSPSGDLLYTESSDLWLFPARGDRKPQLLVGSKFTELDPQVSPDGQWLAYMSDESGETGIHVRGMAPDGIKLRVSNVRAVNPCWSRDGREIYYRSRNDVYGVRFDPATGRAEKPARLFSMTRINRFDVSGDHFVVARRTDEQLGVSLLNVILNWAANLR